MKQPFRVVLFEPEIPQNTGNIARLCACTGAELFLVGKLGFILDEKHVKRAGLDYWDSVKIKRYNHLEDLEAEYPENNFYYLTTKTKQSYAKNTFKEGDFIVFGPESRGLPEKMLSEHPQKCLTIPMKEGQRSLNLANSVSIVLYEAIRQTDFLS